MTPVMTRPDPRRRPAPILALLAAPAATALAAVLALAPGIAVAQAVDCTALRAAVDAADGPADAALRRQRADLHRAQSDADQAGCGEFTFDGPEPPPCQTFERRVAALEAELQDLRDRGSRGGSAGDDRRSALQARFDAECAPDRAEAGDAPVTTVPVDPDAPAGPAAATKASRVFCVRRCDGAYYPLATDVPPERMAEMDRICQAQCPAAGSSAYAGRDDDVSGATASDGSTYAALPAAFGYLKGPSQTCACRAPHQSWAEALAGAEALLAPHKGDVTVTADLAASMARPAPSPPKPVPAGARSSKKAKAKSEPTLTVPVPHPDPERDLTPEFRRGDPTL